MQENEKENMENLENQQPTSPLKEQGRVMMEGHIRIRNWRRYCKQTKCYSL